MAGRAVFPGSFDPLTVAHVGVADAVRRELAVNAVDLVISRVALEKEDLATPVEVRLRAIRRLQDTRPWLGATATDHQLLADIAQGYDVLVIGADKWDQLMDVRYYGGSTAARDEALARVPLVAVAPRTGSAVPQGPRVHVLETPVSHRHVSSTAVRRGRHDWRA